MQQRLKQSVGIDMAKDDFVACFSIMTHGYDNIVLSTQTFKNTISGFRQLNKWVVKLLEESIPTIYVMEPTGVYHQKLAWFLDQDNQKLSIVLPQRAKSFAKTLTTKTVTDKQSAKALSFMGLEKKLELWQKPDEIYDKIRKLTREREQIQHQLTQIKNQQHAEQSGAWPNEKSLKRIKQHIKLLNDQIKEIEEELKVLANSNKELQKKLNHIKTIIGVGTITALTVIGETNGFNLIRNKKQLVSYAGYDVKEKKSGTSVRGKARISHQGNRHIRKAMHMPALTAIKYNPEFKKQYENLVSKHGIKMKALVALQRKQLVLIYTLWKKEEDFVTENKNTDDIINKKIEQPEKTALIELVQDRSLVC